jgi:hypothetical protein
MAGELKDNAWVFFLPCKNAEGKDVLTWVVKRTYDIDPESGRVTPAAEQPPIEECDRYPEGRDASNSTVVVESELAPFKVAADVIVTGRARAPEGLPVPSFDVTVIVGSLKKRLRVFGKRSCTFREPKKESKDATKRVPTPPLFSDPAPVASLELTWEHAYGGKSFIVPLDPEAFAAAKAEALKVDEQARASAGLPPVEPADPDALDELPCPTNPFGKGFILGNFRESVDGVDLPQIEDPDHLLTPENIVVEPIDLPVAPVPAGLGWFGRSWFPRAGLWGVQASEKEDQENQVKERVLDMNPEDADERATIESVLDMKMPVMKPECYNAAAPGMTLKELVGDEGVSITNLEPNGFLSFHLPREKPLLFVDRGRGKEFVPVALDTLFLRTGENRFSLVWRGHLPYGGYDELAEYPGLKPSVEMLPLEEYRDRFIQLPPPPEDRSRPPEEDPAKVEARKDLRKRIAAMRARVEECKEREAEAKK